MVLPRADIAGTRPTATVEPPTPVAASATTRHETFNRLAQIMLGRQLQAEVLSRFNDGTYLVRLADTPARMALPEGTTVGDKLSMTMLAHEPRPTFLLNGEAGSANATLSSAGRMIDTILQIAQRSGTNAALTANEPILPSSVVLAADGTAPQIAEALHDTLEHSGLFYESHLNDWINGTRSAAELMREPQAQNQPQNPIESGQRAHAAPANLQPPSDLDARLAEILSTAQPIAANPATTDADTMLPPAGNSTMSSIDTMQMLPLQLHVLEQRQIVWQGELFPGLPMEWSINDDTPHREAQPEAQQQWQSAVRFELPALGAVAASIVMTGDRVQIQVRTASEETAGALRAHGHELADALAAAGSPLDSLLIKQDEEA